MLKRVIFEVDTILIRVYGILTIYAKSSSTISVDSNINIEQSMVFNMWLPGFFGCKA